MKIRPFSFTRYGVNMAQLKDDTLINKSSTMLADADYEKIKNARLYSNIDEISPEEIIDRAREAQIRDERDGYPISEKLEACVNRKNIIILVDAVDDEPYITSQMCTLVHYKKELAEGIELVLKATGAKGCIIETYLKNSSVEVKNIVPKKIAKYKVKSLNVKYPAEIRIKKLMYTYNNHQYIYIGACSLVHLARAVYSGIKHTTAMVTVAGSAVAHPQVVEATIGTPISDLLERTGFNKKPSRIIIGGSLTGRAIRDFDGEEVELNTQGVLAINDRDTYKDYTCIRCGKCIDVCPMRLNPMELYKNIVRENENNADRINMLDGKMCISCMCCSYVCPAKINLAETILLHNRRNRFKDEV